MRISALHQRFKVIVLVGLLVWGMGLPSASQAQVGTSSPSGSGKELFCRGGSDFSLFLHATLDYDNFVEYFRDFIPFAGRYSQKVCWYQDIESVRKRLNKVRDQIRQAYYFCQDTSKLRATYYRLEAELYYLRKFIFVERGKVIVRPSQEILSDMTEKFAYSKGYFTAEQMNTLFQELQTKHEGKINEYTECKDADWDALVKKWEDFKTNLGGLGAAKDAARSIGQKWDRMANTPLNLGRDFFGGFVDMRINGLSTKEGLTQITDELKKNLPGGFNFYQLQYEQSVAAERYDTQKEEQEYLGRYQAVYRESSDEFMQSTMLKLDLLNEIVKSTYEFQNQTILCTKDIGEKQCGII